jgi:hypothetical protein
VNAVEAGRAKAVRLLLSMGFLPRLASYLAIAALLCTACTHAAVGDITRDRAIEIARSQVTFVVSSVDAAAVSVRGRPVWRVTLRGRLPGQPPELFETRIVEIDRHSGAVISVART